MNETEKHEGLRRIRLIATVLLPAMAVLLYLSGTSRGTHPEWAWVRYFAEASLIGGIADWFAVVALFRYPLGVRLPHTAIIPSNKDRIGTELGRFIDQNFLTPDAITPWLEKQNIVARLLRWVSRPANARAALSAFVDLLRPLSRATSHTGVVDLAAEAVSESLLHTDAAQLFASGLRTLLASGADHPAFDRMLELVAGWLDHNRALIRRRFGEHSPLTSGFFDAFVVNRFIDGIIDLVHEVAADPQHEMRVKFNAEMYRFAERRDTDPLLHEQAAEVQRDVLARIDVAVLLRDLLVTIRRRVSDVDRDRLAEMIAVAACNMMDEKTAVQNLNLRLSHAVAASLSGARLRLSTLVEDVIRAWDTGFMTEKLELEVGRDLQFIRLNGMAVGGLVGLVLHPLLVMAGID